MSKTMKIRITFTEPILGTSPSNPDIYRDYIASKAPDTSTVEDEIDAVSSEEIAEKQMTVFPRNAYGQPFLYDYQIKGFFKGACKALKGVSGTDSSKVKAYKQAIDLRIFPYPREIPFECFDKVGECQRPLRASTPQGERVSLAMSEEIPAGAVIIFDIVMLEDSDEKLVREWLDYGKYSGIGQWRNSGRGRYVWEELDESGARIGGNYDPAAIK